MSTINSETSFIPFPETYTRRELNALYREIPLKDTTSRTLRKYFDAMANLYGVITLKKAYEIISSQSPKLVTESEFLAFAEIARHECGYYHILGRDELFIDGKKGSLFDHEIIDCMLIGDDIDLYIETKLCQSGKEFYIPNKKELLLYADVSYSEETEETTALKTFINNKFNLTEREAFNVFYEILDNTRILTETLNPIFSALETFDLVLDSESDLQELIKLYQDFNNTTRMQCNCGHTPSEINQMYPRKTPRSMAFEPGIQKMIADGTLDINELRRDVLTMDLPSEELRFNMLKELANTENSMKPKKVGRNDPCPCGSGKKYKKCCGR